MKRLPRASLSARGLIVLLAAAFLAIAAAFIGRRRPYPPQEGRKVENFRLLDQADISRELYGYADAKAVVLLIQGNGCPIVRQNTAALGELKRLFTPRGVEFLMINGSPQDSPEAIAREARDFNLAIPILRDEAQAVLRSLGVTRTGEAIVIDPSTWRVAYRGAVDDRLGYEWQRASATHRYLAEALESVLSGKTVNPAETQVNGCLINIRQPAGLTYARDVAPILRRSCLKCHGDKDVPPALTSYAAARDWAPMIRETLMTQRMPPSGADPRYGQFSEEPSLSAQELRTLIDWSELGAPRGEGADLLVPPSQNARKASPRLVLSAENEETIPAAGAEFFRLIALTPRAPEDLNITGIEAARNNRRAAHHIQLLLLPEDLPKTLEESRKVLMDAGRAVSAGPLGWRFRSTPPGTSLFVPKGARLGLNVHYVPSGREERDKPEIALYLAQATPALKPLHRLVIQNSRFLIPPGATDYEVSSGQTLTEDIDIVGFWPHMHTRGAWMRIEAVFPNGKKETLFFVPHFVTRGQRLYELAKPRRLPTGTHLLVRGGFDNSPRNRGNTVPGVAVAAGSRSSDEMFQGHVYWTKPRR